MQTVESALTTAAPIDYLAERWAALKRSQPKLRIRDAAEVLGVSEAELLATECGASVTRLQADAHLLERLDGFGRMMALTRNAHAVHEKKGEYREISFSGPHGLVLNHDIDLRLFPRVWRHAFAVETDRGPHGVLRSLQFFGATGEAIHKAYVLDDDDNDAFFELVREHAAPDQAARLEIEAPAAPSRARFRTPVDLEGFYAGWRALEDTHDFFPLLRKYGMGRLEALMNAPEDLARRVEPSRLEALLTGAAARELPIMVFVGNPGCIQIHTGPVQKVRRLGAWLNILDEGFNLHLHEPGVASAWMVRKPTADGDVTSLELFDAKGENIALLFGERKPGIPELPEWRELLGATMDSKGEAP